MLKMVLRMGPGPPFWVPRGPGPPFWASLDPMWLHSAPGRFLEDFGAHWDVILSPTSVTCGVFFG